MTLPGQPAVAPVDARAEAADGPAGPPARMAHIPALDGLRGAAVAGVLIYHLGHLKGGYLGVDLFFVLSGFLITSLLLAEHRAAGRIDLRAFWGRRARRLLPALWLLMMGVAVYAVVVARPIDLPAMRADAFATIGYVANWHAIAGGASYWDISLAPSPLQHTWSLAIEEQFYVVWPLLFVFLVTRARRGRGRGPDDLPRLVLQVALAGAAVSAAAMVLLHGGGSSDTRVYEGTDTRAAALLLGVALAAWRMREADPAAATSRSTVRASHLVEGAGVAAVLALALLWLGLDGQSPWVYRGGLAAASLLATAAVAAASRPSSAIVGRAFRATPLRWLGAISYGLYLWHWPVYQGLDAMNGRFPGLGRRHLEGGELVAAKLGLSLVVALGSYWLLEQPIRRGRIPTRLGPVAIGGAAITAGLAVFVATMGGIHADPIAPTTGTQLARVEGAPDLWVAGDSVALSVASRLYADPARYGVNPADHTRIGCSLVTPGLPARSFTGQPIEPPACATYALDGIEAARPDIVYLLAGARPNDQVQIDGRWVGACDPAFDARLRANAIDLVQRFQAVGAQVVVGTVLHSGAQSLPVEGAEERIDCANRAIESLPAAVDGVHVVDTNALLCPHGPPCTEALDGAPVRSDGLHFDRGPGGDAVADWITARILEAAGSPADRGSDPRSDPGTATDAGDGGSELAQTVPPRTLAWLDRMSRQAIGRAMDPEAERFWATRLVSGAPRVEVTENLVNTETWRRHRVTEAYQHWLGTNPDAVSLDRWQRWLLSNPTSELDIRLASSADGRAAAGSTDPERAVHLAEDLNLPKAAPHFAKQLADGLPWGTVVREGYLSHPASDRRMLDLAPPSPYTPGLVEQVAEFRASGDERVPLARALATLA